MNGKKILALDFDGVVHGYQSGWKGATVIPDPPVPGALDFILSASKRFDVMIVSSRTGHHGGIKAIKEWLMYWVQKEKGVAWDENVKTIFHLKVVRNKPAAHITLDDRGITFTGAWPNLDLVDRFKPWNR